MSLDDELLVEIERVRGRTGESRSALIRRALEQLLDRERLQQQAREYRARYRSRPESAPDVAAALAQTQAAWATLEEGEAW